VDLGPRRGRRPARVPPERAWTEPGPGSTCPASGATGSYGRAATGPLVAEGYAGASAVEDDAAASRFERARRRADSGCTSHRRARPRGGDRRAPPSEPSRAPGPGAGAGPRGPHPCRGSASGSRPPTAAGPRARPRVAGLSGPSRSPHRTHRRRRPGPRQPRPPSRPVDPGPTRPDPLPAIDARLDLSRNGARLGLQLQYGGLRVGAAVVRASADQRRWLRPRVRPHGPELQRRRCHGLEVTGRIPTGWAPLRMEGWYVAMERPGTWLYRPPNSGAPRSSTTTSPSRPGTWSSTAVQSTASADP
jgi:hypothetical protein